jgi:uncharacterized protein (DUF952 family)
MTDLPPSIVYKVCDRESWRAAEADGAFAGSADDLRDGFIHLSTAEQLAGTLRRHFAGRSDLLLVAVATEALQARLRWEPSRGGQLFPHLYGALDMRAVRSVTPITLGADGSHVLASGTG